MNFSSQGVELRLESGSGISDIICDNIQNISLASQNNRQETTYLGNFSANSEKPIINYTPTQLTFSYTKTNNNLIEENIGLLNYSGCFINLIANNNINDYSSRNYKLIYRPPNSRNYNGQINLYSGYLNTYSINVSIGTPIACSVAVECLDIESIQNTETQVATTGKSIIRPENVSITGINFSGYGISGLQIQSFNINLSVQRNNSFLIGQKFPEKTIINTNGSVQINGFINNLTQLNKLSTINQQNPDNSIYLTLKENCSENNILSIKIQNPYLESKQITNEVGNMANISLNFTVNPTIKINETGRENVIFS